MHDWRAELYENGEKSLCCSFQLGSAHENFWLCLKQACVTRPAEIEDVSPRGHYNI